jgi:hypothetical protein
LEYLVISLWKEGINEQVALINSIRSLRVILINDYDQQIDTLGFRDDLLIIYKSKECKWCVGHSNLVNAYKLDYSWHQMIQHR